MHAIRMWMALNLNYWAAFCCSELKSRQPASGCVSRCLLSLTQPDASMHQWREATPVLAVGLRFAVFGAALHVETLFRRYFVRDSDDCSASLWGSVQSASKKWRIMWLYVGCSELWPVSSLSACEIQCTEIQNRCTSLSIVSAAIVTSVCEGGDSLATISEVRSVVTGPLVLFWFRSIFNDSWSWL